MPRRRPLVASATSLRLRSAGRADFSGVESISNGFREAGFCFYSYDNIHGPKEDVCTDAGFIFGLILCLRIREGGFCWLAPLCSSWVWISSGTTLRSTAFPEGLTDNAASRYGNKMVARIMLYCWIMKARGVAVCVEQPTSSLMSASRWFQDFLRAVPMYQTRVNLGCFNGDSAKPIYVYSTERWFRYLHDYRTRYRGPPFSASSSSSSFSFPLLLLLLPDSGDPGRGPVGGPNRPSFQEALPLFGPALAQALLLPDTELPLPRPSFLLLLCLLLCLVLLLHPSSRAERIAPSFGSRMAERWADMAEDAEVVQQLSLWEASDLRTEVMQRHFGPTLQQMGVQVRERDLFQLFQDGDLARRPAIVIIACLCPTKELRSELDNLLYTYLRRRVDAAERRIVYDAITYEAAVGQLPQATVVSISRRSDCLRATSTPSTVLSMKRIIGYTPVECHHGPDEALRPLNDAHELVARINTTGPCNPQSFTDANGEFNLPAMCFQATVWNWPVLFTGEWDGSLCHACAFEVWANMLPATIPRQPAPFQCRHVSKVMGGHVGQYAEFYDYAEERRITQLLGARLWHISQQNEVDSELPVQAIQPHVKLNAAVMWHFATPVASAHRGL